MLLFFQDQEEEVAKQEEDVKRKEDEEKRAAEKAAPRACARKPREISMPLRRSSENQ